MKNRVKRQARPHFLLLIAALSALWAPARAGERSEHTIRVDGRERSYPVWVPEGHDRARAMPVVLVFHGGGGSIESMEDTSDLHNAPGAANFIFVYAAGYARTYNVGGYCCGAKARENVDDIRFVHAVLEDLGRTVRIDQRRIYATGFSNGGQFSYYLACKMGDEIAAIVSAGGAMQPPFDQCRPARAMPVMHWAGLSDRFDPFEGGRSAIPTAPIQPPVRTGIDFWRRINGGNNETSIDLVGPAADCTLSSGRDDAHTILCLVPGLGHHWPGSVPRRMNPIVMERLGPVGPRIDANKAILDFFAQHALPDS